MLQRFFNYMRFQTTHNFWHRLMNSRFFLLGLIVILILIGVAIFRERNDYAKNAENIAVLENEISALEKESADLDKLVAYLRSNEFVEDEAREKLNMKKVGEEVIVVPEKKPANESALARNSLWAEKKNWQLWLDYLAGREKF